MKKLFNQNKHSEKNEEDLEGGTNGEVEKDKNRNIFLETYDSIRDDLRRGKHLFTIRVRIVRGRQIQGGNISPKVLIKLGKQSRTTQREQVSTNEPFWGENFFYNVITDVDSLLKDQLKFQVINCRTMRTNITIGEFVLNLVLVAGEHKRTMINKWLVMIDPKDPSAGAKGFLQICVGLIIPEEEQLRWPDALEQNEEKDDMEDKLLTCTGNAFYRMIFKLRIFFLEDIPQFNDKGEHIDDISIGFSFAGKNIVTPIIDLPTERMKRIELNKELSLSIAWPSMCSKLLLNVYNVKGKKVEPLGFHAFALKDIAVESNEALYENVKVQEIQRKQEKSKDGGDNSSPSTKTSSPMSKNKIHMKKLEKVNDQKRKNAEAGFLPTLGPCYVNLYGAPLDIFDNSVDPKCMIMMNQGMVEGSNYRGRVFLRLTSQPGESEESKVEDVKLGTKDERDLLAHLRTNTYLLFGTITNVSMMGDIKKPVQFELSIGHHGINTISNLTKSKVYPSTTYGINTCESLRTLRELTGHSNYYIPIESSKPAFLVESAWEDIRYRIHFFNFVNSLYCFCDKNTNLVIMAFKLGLGKIKLLEMIRDLCHHLILSFKNTPLPSPKPAEAENNDVDKHWKKLRRKQFSEILFRIAKLLNSAHKQLKMPTDNTTLLSEMCNELVSVSFLLHNILREPQLSIPDIIIYMIVNGQRRAYARIPICDVYYCGKEAQKDVLSDAIDVSKYRGRNANISQTIFMKTLFGFRDIDEREFWPVPCMLQIKLIFGLSSILKDAILPAFDYYVIMYQYEKLRTGNKNVSFFTDASGINTIEADSAILTDNPSMEVENNNCHWQWVGDWEPWPDWAAITNSQMEVMSDFVYKVHSRITKVVGDSARSSWSFMGYFTEDMKQIKVNTPQLSDFFGIDWTKWRVVYDKSERREKSAWNEVYGFEEYCSDIKFEPSNITSTLRLESNYARKLLQRKRERRDAIFVESIYMIYELTGSRWKLSFIRRFDGVSETYELDKASIREWKNLLDLPPMAVNPNTISGDLASGEKLSLNIIKSKANTLTFRWLGHWVEHSAPVESNDIHFDDVVQHGSFLKVTFDRKKIMDKDAETDVVSDAIFVNGPKIYEYAPSMHDHSFHGNLQRHDQIRRARIRRKIEPASSGMIITSAERSKTMILSAFPSFKVKKRNFIKSRFCCLFNTTEYIPTPITVNIVSPNTQLSRWEIRCYLHEARDLVITEQNENIYVYAIVSVAGCSEPSSVIQNDFSTQLFHWNETLIFRNINMFGDPDEIEKAPPLIVIEFFRKQFIHNDQFLGRCVVDKDTLIFDNGYKNIGQRDAVLQWYKIHLRGVENAGCVLAGFEMRRKATFRPPKQAFDKIVRTPALKKIAELARQEKVILDNKTRFEIPENILPYMVPHIVKITSWSLRHLKKYKFSKIKRPSVEFRIGHNVLVTEKLIMEKSPEFLQKSRSILVYLPLETSYLPELVIVVKDSRAFGRTPTTGLCKIPLHPRRFFDFDNLLELSDGDVASFLKEIRRVFVNPEEEYGICKLEKIKPSSDSHEQMLLNVTHQFSPLLAGPDQKRNDSMKIDQMIENTVEGDDKKKNKLAIRKRLGEKLKNIFQLRDDTEDQIVKPRMVAGDEKLSQSKSDWWCKYYYSKENVTVKSVGYLEGDRLEYYKVSLEEAHVCTGDNRSLSVFNGTVMPTQTDGETIENIVAYNNFSDVYQTLKLERLNALTTDEEGHYFGDFCGDCKLYYLGPLPNQTSMLQKLEELWTVGARINTKKKEYPLFVGPPSKSEVSCVIRVYIVKGYDLQPSNLTSLPSTYIQVYIADDQSGKKIQKQNNKDNVVEMETNPTYGAMFELQCMLPQHSDLVVSVMDKGLFMDEEIGQTVVNIEKRNHTYFRATCGLQEIYRTAGINTWRDQILPSEILKNLCTRLNMPPPLFFFENDESDDESKEGERNRHRCTIYPPERTYKSEAELTTEVVHVHKSTADTESFNYFETNESSNSFKSQHSMNSKQFNASNDEIITKRLLSLNTNANNDDETNTTAQVPEVRTITKTTMKQSKQAPEIFRTNLSESSVSSPPPPIFLSSSDDFDPLQNSNFPLPPAGISPESKTPDFINKHNEANQTTVEMIQLTDAKNMGEIETNTDIYNNYRHEACDRINKVKLPGPVTYALEDFDLMYELKGVKLGPNDNDDDIAKERLALAILRRLPLVREHVETRPLYNELQPGIIQGYIEMFVDIFPATETCEENNANEENGNGDDESKYKLPPAIDISPRKPEPYELRIVIWNLQEVINDKNRSSNKETGDLYVRGWMEGLGDTLETDINYNTIAGDAAFNWRFIYKLNYMPHERAICAKRKIGLFHRAPVHIPPKMHIQVWDNQKFSFDDFVGSIEFDLSHMPSPAREPEDCALRRRYDMEIETNNAHLLSQATHKSEVDHDTVDLFESRRVYGYWPLSLCNEMELSEGKSGMWMVGKILLEMEILSLEEAAAKPAGLGRSEPNANPYLPEPKRVSLNNSWCTGPLNACRKSCWPRYKWYLLGLITIILIVVVFVVIIYQGFFMRPTAKFVPVTNNG